MTIEALAEAAETSYQFLSQVEKGEQVMTAVKFARLAKALRVSSDYLLFGSDQSASTALAVEFLSALSPIERDLLSRQVVLLQGLLDTLSPEQ